MAKRDRSEKHENKTEPAVTASAPQPTLPLEAAAPAPADSEGGMADSSPGEAPREPASATEASVPAVEASVLVEAAAAPAKVQVVVTSAANPPPGYAQDPLGYAEGLEGEGRFDEAARIREAEGLPEVPVEEREAYRFRRQVDGLAETNPEFRQKLVELSAKYEQAFYEELRGVVAALGTEKQDIVRGASRYKVLAPVRVAINGGIRDLKADEILDESALGPQTIKALLAEPKVKLEKIKD